LVALSVFSEQALYFCVLSLPADVFSLHTMSRLIKWMGNNVFLIGGFCMRTLMILLLFLFGGLIIGFAIWFIPPKLRPQYTAQTFIRVMSTSETAPTIDLIRHQGTLSILLDKDNVQWTGWFNGLGKTKDERLKAGISELNKRICAKSRRGSNLVRISMTCDNGGDAAVIANEMATMFINMQSGAKRKQIAENLSQLEVHQVRVQRDLDLAERALDDVRRRYGFADLEQHNFPHPFTERLIRLQREEDDCAIEISQLKILNDELQSRAAAKSSGKTEPNQAAEIKDSQLRLKLLQGKFAELAKMREEAAKNQEEFDLARAQFEQRQAIRDERKAMLDSIKSSSEELKILHDSPDIAGLQLVADAPTPMQPDCPPWQIPVSAAGLSGFVLGIVFVCLTKKPKNTN
jgi:capsular polysaccharide biosynthesis protein